MPALFGLMLQTEHSYGGSSIASSQTDRRQQHGLSKAFEVRDFPLSAVVRRNFQEWERDWPTPGAHSGPHKASVGSPLSGQEKNKQGETLRIFLGDLCELNLGHTLAMTLGLQSSLPAAKLQEALTNFALSQFGALGCRRVTMESTVSAVLHSVTYCVSTLAWETLP